MEKIEEEERESLTNRNKNDNFELSYVGLKDKAGKKKKKGKKKGGGKKSKGAKKENKKTNLEEENTKEDKKKLTVNNEMFILNTYQIIRMLGFGTFGEIHLAYETSSKQLRAIKFETINQKNPQLKHEHNILEMLNKLENSEIPEGIPKVYGFEKTERYSYMMMEFLGPSLSDLFQFCNKKFSLKTVCILAIQMLQRIEYVHEKGFIHRDIKPENFVIGLNEKSNIVHIIDFGLSKRYKDRNTGQHIPYRENRQLVGTVRYASINAHLGIEQSRRDDIESIGYVLVYFLLGRLPWQSKVDKKKQTTKIMEKKLMTPPEILCKKLPIEFAYYFHYCKNLKYEDRPDYTTLKYLFYNLLIPDDNLYNEFVFDWFDENEDNKKDDEAIAANTAFDFKKTSNNQNLKRKSNIFDINKITADGRITPKHYESDDSSDKENKLEEDEDEEEDQDNNKYDDYQNREPMIVKNSLIRNSPKNYQGDDMDKMNTIDYLIKNKQNDANLKIKDKKANDDSSDTDRDAPMNDEPIKNLIQSESLSQKNSDSHYKLLSSSDKSEDKKGSTNTPLNDEDIVFKNKGKSKLEKEEKSKEGDVFIKINSKRK